MLTTIKRAISSAVVIAGISVLASPAVAITRQEATAMCKIELGCAGKAGEGRGRVGMCAQTVPNCVKEKMGSQTKK